MSNANACVISALGKGVTTEKTLLVEAACYNLVLAAKR